jgi:hypothetical protein
MTTDEQRQNIIRPVLRRVYKKGENHEVHTIVPILFS